MPLHVHCPEGCSLRVPEKCAGKIIRCPKCKTSIQLPEITEIENLPQSDGPIHGKRINTDGPSKDNLKTPENDQRRTENTTTKSADHSKIQGQKTTSIRRPLATPAPSGRKNTPEPQTTTHALQPNRLDPNTPEPSKAPPRAEQKLNEVADGHLIIRQYERSTADRFVLARFYSICVALTGIFNLIPAIYYWYFWGHNDIDLSLPRWIYLQIFVAGLHFIYSIYLYQIPDWSTLRTVAVAMLLFAMMYAIISSGLLLGSSTGAIGQFLRIPNSLENQATIWCVAMLCLSTLISYLTGRESALWCRTEKLLNQIITMRN